MLTSWTKQRKNAVAGRAEHWGGTEDTGTKASSEKPNLSSCYAHDMLGYTLIPEGNGLVRKFRIS